LSHLLVRNTEKTAAPWHNNNPARLGDFLERHLPWVRGAIPSRRKWPRPCFSRAAKPSEVANVHRFTALNLQP